MPDKSLGVLLHLSKKGKIKEILLPPLKNANRKFWTRKGKIIYHLPNKRGMGRSKGNSLERETADELSLWIYGKKKILKRTPLSGGWATGKAGDVILDHEQKRKKKIFDPDLYVECRNYKDVLQHDLLSWNCFGTPKTYGKWIDEVEKKARNRFPMIVIKGKRTKPYVFILKRWLTQYTLQDTRLASKFALFNKDYGIIFVIPLTRIKRLGDAKIYFKQWREDGGPSNIRRLGKRS